MVSRLDALKCPSLIITLIIPTRRENLITILTNTIQQIEADKSKVLYIYIDVIILNIGLEPCLPGFFCELWGSKFLSLYLWGKHFPLSYLSAHSPQKV